ncbi:NAD(P)H-hydrate dehydratase [bacterium]|nr:NAD(P)H-hydrate dehydratase [bacterium]
MIKVTKNILKKIYHPRPENASKYNYGILIVIGGGEFYTGSPALAAMAGFRAGVDMVHILAPERAANIIASFSPNLATFGLEGKWLNKDNLSTLLLMTESAEKVSHRKAAVVIGGGVGRSAQTKEAILEYLKEVSLPVVIDADALHAVAGNLDVIRGKNWLLTPHLYEFFVLTGKKIQELSLVDKIKVVQEEARKLNCTLLLKGRKDIISNGSDVALNEAGTPYLTVGGTGDTLAGICGSLMAQGADSFLSAQAGAFINGKAGEIAGKRFGSSLLATDLVDCISQVIKR